MIWMPLGAVPSSADSHHGLGGRHGPVATRQCPAPRGCGPWASRGAAGRAGRGRHVCGQEPLPSACRSRLQGDGPEQGRSLPAALAAEPPAWAAPLAPKDEDQLQDTALAWCAPGCAGPGRRWRFFAPRRPWPWAGCWPWARARCVADIQVPPGLLALALLTPAALGMYLPNVWLRTRNQPPQARARSRHARRPGPSGVCVEAAWPGPALGPRGARISLTSPALGPGAAHRDPGSCARASRGPTPCATWPGAPTWRT
jgi:hypothetical protein